MGDYRKYCLVFTLIHLFIVLFLSFQVAEDEDEDMEDFKETVVATVAALQAQTVVDVEAAATRVAEADFQEAVVVSTPTWPCPRPADTRTWSPNS